MKVDGWLISIYCKAGPVNSQTPLNKCFYNYKEFLLLKISQENCTLQNRPWYDEALANKDSIMISVPYTDAFGAGTILTIAHTILEKNRYQDAL